MYLQTDREGLKNLSHEEKKSSQKLESANTKVSIDVEKRLDTKRIDVELVSMEYERVKKEYEDLQGE